MEAEEVKEKNRLVGQVGWYMGKRGLEEKRKRWMEQEEAEEGIWADFLEMEADLANISNESARFLLSHIATDMAAFKAQNKRALELIKGDKREELIGGLCARAGRAADEKVLQALAAYCDNRLQAFQEASALLAGFKEKLEARREYLAEEEEGGDEASIPELLDTLPDLELAPATITFRRVHLSTHDQPARQSGPLSLSLAYMTLSFVEKSMGSRFEFPLGAISRCEPIQRRELPAKPKEASRKKKKACSLKLWSEGSKVPPPSYFLPRSLNKSPPFYPSIRLVPSPSSLLPRGISSSRFLKKQGLRFLKKAPRVSQALIVCSVRPPPLPSLLPPLPQTFQNSSSVPLSFLWRANPPDQERKKVCSKLLCHILFLNMGLLVLMLSFLIM